MPEDQNNIRDIENHHDQEAAALMQTPEWHRLMAEMDAEAKVKANSDKAPNVEAFSRLAFIMTSLNTIKYKSDPTLEVIYDYDADDDDALVLFMGVGADLSGSMKDLFVAAIKAADKVDLQADNTGDKFNMTFIVYSLYNYSGKSDMV